MLDKNGEELKVGDLVYWSDYDGDIREGSVSSFLNSLNMVYVQNQESKLFHLMDCGVIEKI